MASESPSSAARSAENSESDIEPIRIGVLAVNSAVSAHNRYAPLVDYLSQKLDRPFELLPATQVSQFDAVKEEKVDFIINNPLAAVQIQRLYRTELLVTHFRPLSGAQFSGLIIVRSDSDIQGMDDLHGKQVACVNFQAGAGGCLFQMYYLRQNDIDPFQDFGTFREIPSQDNIVLSVLNGTIDAGFIRTGQLEKMQESNILQNPNDIRVLKPVADEFFFEHTTRLYPEWPISAMPGTDPDLRAQMKTALLQLEKNHSALAAANVESFVEAVDYQPMHALIETLKLRSWDAAQ
ncbi:MAG: phosphate/phosphite/phosphonate ABC transporter substrate-binding protein [Cyanobacteria bacterium P01_F01_bin.42]